MGTIYRLDPKIMKIKRPWRMRLFLLFHLMTHSIDLTIYNQLSKKKTSNDICSRPTEKKPSHGMYWPMFFDHLPALPLPNQNTPALWQLFSDLLPILALHAGHQVIPIARMHMFHALDLAVGCRKGNWNYTLKLCILNSTKSSDDSDGIAHVNHPWVRSLRCHHPSWLPRLAPQKPVP